MLERLHLGAQLPVTEQDELSIGKTFCNLLGRLNPEYRPFFRGKAKDAADNKSVFAQPEFTPDFGCLISQPPRFEKKYDSV